MLIASAVLHTIALLLPGPLLLRPGATAAAGRSGTCVGRAEAATQRSFDISVNLGEDGIVTGVLRALFTRSTLVTVRYPLPFALEAEYVAGAWTKLSRRLLLSAGQILVGLEC